MSLALQVLVTGVAAGGVYGLLAAGHSLLYRLTGVVHFALGDLVGLGVFTTLFVAAGTGPVTQATANGPRFAAALIAGLLVCVGAGIGSYLFVVHPYLVRGSIVGSVAAIVAVAFAVRAILAAIFDRPAYVFPDVLPFRRIGREGFVEIGGASIQARAFFVIAVALALALLAAWVLERTRFGRALRAVASDTEGARIVGVPVERLIALAFGLAGGLAATAAIVAAPSGAVDADTGALLGVKGLVAAIVVRFGSPLAAMAAGVGLGLLEAGIANFHIASLELGPQYSQVIPIVIALLLIALRPQAEALELRE